MGTPFKMKEFSGFGNSPMKQTKGPKMPKNHPVTPPTKEESEKSKGTLKGLTKFVSDFKKFDKHPIETIKQDFSRGKTTVKRKVKKVYDYFTKK